VYPVLIIFTVVKYKVISIEDIAAFKNMIGERFVFTDEENLKKYGQDETEDLLFLPEVVLKPGNTKEISQIMQYCNDRMIPVTPRAAGTGLSGGALPVHGGVLLSVERLNKILEIDERNLQVITQPGVITQTLQEAVIVKGLYYPPDPASRGSCFIGGNIAENSGGPRAVKYGVVKDYVLNLEVVLPDGSIIWTGANVLKNSTGYNLTQLMVGSEGTLGIVTKIVLRLIPWPPYNTVLFVPFYDLEQAAKAVSAIFMGGITPSAMELMEREAIEMAITYLKDVKIPLEENIQAHLIIEVDGFDKNHIMASCEKIYHILSGFDTGEILLAESEKEKDDIWRMRRVIGEAVKTFSVYKEEDTVVPRAELPVLLKGVKSICRKYGFRSVCFGHAGDGNLHVNILKDNLNEEKWNKDVIKGIREIFKLTKSLGGTISGEHGIGFVQKEFMEIVFSPVEIGLLKGIKKVFDPNHILNPGKIFP
jgi:glycolate oxidase subunit GlcD